MSVHGTEAQTLNGIPWHPKIRKSVRSPAKRGGVEVTHYAPKPGAGLEAESANMVGEGSETKEKDCWTAGGER